MTRWMGNMAHLRDMRQEHISQKLKGKTSLGKHGFTCENNTFENSSSWDVKLCAFFLDCLTLKMEAGYFSKTTVNYCQLTHHNILEDLNLQQHRCENIIPNDILLFFWFIMLFCNYDYVMLMVNE